MKKIILCLPVMFTSLVCMNIHNLGIYDPVLSQLQANIANKKVIPHNLSKELCNVYLSYINSSETLKIKYFGLAQQLGQLLTPPKRLVFSEQDLDKIAITQGYGYKYANLTELVKLGERTKVNNVTYTIKVPLFAGISSASIQTFLLQRAAIDIATEWRSIISHYFPNQTVQNELLQNKKYPDGFLQACEKLALDCKRGFRETADATAHTLSFNDAFSANGVDQLIAYIEQRKQRLMVRSTGKEDTKVLANAGGNESISNVQPTVKDILYAMGDVIASYFSQKSLTQRLGAKDLSLFDPVPFTPVLLQHMIGESRSHVPKCGVMFTEEPEGGISRYDYKNPDGSIQTTGITIIQAAYGHNEGVVNSLIPVDTFYVDNAHAMYPVIRPKTYRMVPSNASRTIELKKNDAAIVTKPALSKDAVTVLKHYAQQLEQFYGYPVDVEFVINEQEKTIYIVQARPLVHNPDLPQPSYLATLDTISSESKIGCSAIGVAGGALRWCTNKNQIIIAENIGKALQLYQDLESQTMQIQCIIVGKMAPSTSHEATTFRSEGKPVLCVQQLHAIEQLLAQPSFNLVISPQQGVIVDWKHNGSVQELLTQKKAVQGWIEYPTPPFMSLSDEFKPTQSLTDATLKAVLPSTINADQFMQTLSQTQISSSWKEYIHALKTAPAEKASIVLATFLYEIRQAIREKVVAVELDPAMFDKILLLQRYLLYCAQQIKENLIYSVTDRDYTKRLLPIHFFESLLYQQPNYDEIIAGYSTATVVAKELASEQKITQELAQEGITPDPFTVQYMKIKDVALVPELENSWTFFITQLAQQTDKKIQHDFAQLILNLGKLDIIPIWLNTSFAQTCKSGLSAASCAQQLIKEYNSQSNFFTQLLEKKSIIETLNVDNFADPKKFDTQWKAFSGNVITYFISGHEFRDSYNNANNLGKLVALNVMAQLVDAFDLSIKAVTGSTQYKLEDKLSTFKLMLTAYKNLLDAWVNWIPQGIIKYHHKSPASHYIAAIDEILNKSQIFKNDLKSSAEFNVAAFTIGSGLNLEGILINKPTTLEDIFTMIHQCLLVTLNALNYSAGISTIQLPSALQNINDSIKSLTIENTQAMLSCINISGSTIKIYYNLTLRSHSMQIELRYAKNASSAHLLLYFFGGNEGMRWNKIACIMQSLSSFLNITVDEVAISTNGLMLQIAFNIQNEIQRLLSFIQNIAQYSFDLQSTFIETYLEHLYSTRERIFKKKLCSPTLFFAILLKARYKKVSMQALESIHHTILAHNASDQDKEEAKDIIRDLDPTALESGRTLQIIHDFSGKNEEFIASQLYFLLLEKATVEIQSTETTIKRAGETLLTTLLSELQSLLTKKQDTALSYTSKLIIAAASRAVAYSNLEENRRNGVALFEAISNYPSMANDTLKKLHFLTDVMQGIPEDIKQKLKKIAKKLK